MEGTTKALVIIDFQNDYFKGGKYELVGTEEAAKNAKLLLDHFRAKQLPVIIVEHHNNFEGAPFFVPGTEGVKTHESLKPNENETVIIKTTPGSFNKTELHQVLQKLKVKNLVIVGAMSHMCIDTTVREAFPLGYTCEVISDACATRDLVFEGRVVKAADVHAAFMAALKMAFAKVLKTEEYLKEN